MLVLSRKKNESIRINGDIKVTVLEVRNGRIVRLGITAPKTITVDREEVAEAKERQDR